MQDAINTIPAIFIKQYQHLETGSLLKVSNLQVDFTSNGQSVIAASGISFALNRGETLGIVGESGSGKTVTALSLLRLIQPPGKISNGEVYYTRQGAWPVNLLSLPGPAMRSYRGKEIAMIFQEPMTSLNPVFTCGNQVMETITLHLKESKAEAKDRTLSLFEKVRLADPVRIFHAYPHQLSGGQKQRVMIAMAMSCHPSILIADEPTTALDVTVQSHILELMAQLREEHNMSLIFITHDLAVVAEVADRVLVMYKGRVVEEGPVHQIFSDPRHPYTKGLLACRPPLQQKLRRLPVIHDFMKEAADGSWTELPARSDEVIAANVIPEAETETRLQDLQANPPVLTVRKLCVHFLSEQNFFSTVKQDTKAVDDVSFNVYPGETLGLVGESGSGKTTLGRSILQLLAPTHGEIIFEGKHLSSLSFEEMQPVRRHLQIIFQDPYASLNPRMAIGNALMEPMQVHHIHDSDAVRRERVFDLLNKVSMPADSFHRYPHEFSGGQRQRICIARALTLHPRFIVCDEPVSALDVSVQAQVLNLLKALQEEFKLTYIFISHDLSIVKFMSDRIMVMNHGRMEEIGKADEIYHHPTTEYTRRLIRAIPSGKARKGFTTA